MQQRQYQSSAASWPGAASVRNGSRSVLQVDGARALQDEIEEFSFQLVKNWRRRASVPAELAAIHNITVSALGRAASRWNYERNWLRKLPVEVLEYCWFFLSTPDLVRAAAVCRAWRQTIHHNPALWTNITFFDRHSLSFRRHLGPILDRSKDKLLCVSILFNFNVDQFELSSVLKTHAHRLYGLELRHFDPLIPAGQIIQTIIFDFTAPELHYFISDSPNLVFNSGTFQRSCPKLQHVRVAGLALDETITPFSSVESLAFKWILPMADHIQLFKLFPCLVRLEICGNGRTAELRNSRPPDSLQHVVLRGMDISSHTLFDSGLAYVRVLEVRGRTFDNTLKAFEYLGGTPRSVHIMHCRLTIVSDTKSAHDEPPVQPFRTFRISFPIDNFGQYGCILELQAVRNNITSLTLSPNAFVGDTVRYFVFPQHDFPALQTLILLVVSTALGPGELHSLLNLNIMQHCGKLHATALRRLVIARCPCDYDALCGPVEPILPSAVAVFVSRHLELAPDRILAELYLDGDRGIKFLEGGECDGSMEVLESYVGTIVRRYERQESWTEYIQLPFLRAYDVSWDLARK